MPRSQTTHRQSIRQDLIRKGRELFARYGLKGTSVRELTRAVGIAQGSFYSFFEAKEELFFEILEKEEAAIAQKIIAEINAQKLTRARLKSMIEWSLKELRENPILLTVLDPIEYKRLLRKVPPERLRSHMQKEQNLLARAFAGIRADGLIASIEPDDLAGLLHALFVITLHQEEIGAEVFSRIFDLLIRLVADHVATRGERTIKP